jgi:hypothetical protein
MNILKIAIFGLLSIGLATLVVAFLSRPVHTAQADSNSQNPSSFLVR